MDIQKIHAELNRYWTLSETSKDGMWLLDNWEGLLNLTTNLFNEVKRLKDQYEK